jgi:hypothetical protein
MVCSAQAQPVTFEDVTVPAGVDYTHWSPKPSDPLYCREIHRMSGGAAAGDYDDDGWVDLYYTRLQAPNCLFRNLGNGTFQEVAGAAGVALSSESSGCVWGDIDNDGDLDLYVLTIVENGRNFLYINDGAGHFMESAVARGVDMACGECRHNCTSAAFGDYDRDGDLDLHVLEWWYTDALNRLFQNDGTGYFDDVTSNALVEMPNVRGFANAFADVNGDGWDDLLVAADFGTSRLFLNLGNGQFTDITESAGVGTDENGMGSAVGDMDNDSDLDWFVTSIYDPDETCETAPCGWGYSGNRLYRNENGSLFSDFTDTAGVRDGAWGWGASFLDFDNDGDLDLGMTNGMDSPCAKWEDPFNNDALRFWQNDGTGVMTEVGATVQFTDTGSGKGFVVFDYDRDGDPDVLIVNNAAKPVLYRNNGGNDNAWLRVALHGHTTNRFGIGARVRVQVTGSGPTQLRQVSANSNYMSQNEVIAHFGLGSGITTVHSVEVEWPVSGLVRSFSNVVPNRVMKIHEVEPGDYDTDGDVDSYDAAAFIGCLTGPNGGPLTPVCAPGDLDADDDIDVIDFVLFSVIFSSQGTL